MATERIDIVVTERGSRVVKRSLEGIGDGARQSSAGVDFLKRALASLGVAFGVREILQTLDAYTNLQNRLRSTGLEGRNLAGVYNELLEVANRTRSSVQGSVELYSRLAISSKELGVSQRDLIDFTESLNQAILLSGANAQEAEAGLIQLSQGMASGTLRGDELRSVLEQLPAVADVIAKQLGVTRGELRKMGEDGKITANTILDAFASARGELADRFAKTVPTLGQSFTVLKNEFITLMGEFDSATGITKTLSGLLLALAENLDTVLKAVVGLSAGWVLVQGGATAFNAVTAAVKGLTLAIASNPFGFLLVVLTSVIATLTLFRDEIKLGTDDITTLGDLMQAVGENLEAVFTSIVDAAEDLFGPLVTHIREWWQTVDISLKGILTAVAKAVDLFVGFWIGAIDGVIQEFRHFGEVAALYLSGDIAGGVASALTFGQRLGSAIVTGATETTTAQDFVGGLFDRASQIAAERAAAGTGGGTVSTAKGPRTQVVDPNALKELEEFIKKLEGLVGTYDKVWAAQRQVAEAQNILDEAVRRNLITEARRTEIMGLVRKQLEDQLDPLGAIHRELDEQYRLLGLLNNEREIETQLISLKNDLIAAGLPAGEAELQQLREKLQLIQQETAAAQARQSVYDSIKGAQEAFKLELQAINDLMAQGAITQEEANAFLVAQNEQMLAGTIEHQQAMLTNLQQYYAQVDALRQADLISEQTAAQLKARAEINYQLQRLQGAQQFFGTLAGLQTSENRKLAAIGKAAAIAQATMDGWVAVQRALAGPPGPPWSYAIAAAAAAVAGANVAKIASTPLPGFAFGGGVEVGGVGGTDSQTVAFRATPGERVRITTPTQDREEARRAGAMQNASGGIRIINVTDPRMVADFFATEEGDEVIVNSMRRNSDSIRPLVSGNTL